MKYLAKITPLSAHPDIKSSMHPNTPCVMLKQIYPNTKPKTGNEYIINATSRASAWAKAKRLARRMARPSMNVHMDHAIDVLQLVWTD